MKGFTLIEVIVTIFIFALIVGALSGMVVLLYRTHDYSWQQSLAIDEARRGVDNMVKEIREARSGEDGSYSIETAADKEFVFYSDIDDDGQTERVRYFLGTVGAGEETQECQTSVKGGTCGVTFSDFLTGTLISAQVKVSVDGDFGSFVEYADIFADGTDLGEICRSACHDCTGTWQGTSSFNVASQANDDNVYMLADASSWVDPQCPHSMNVKFEFSFSEDISNFAHDFKKGVTEPVIGGNGEINYPLDQEAVIVISPHVRNAPPIFEYYDQDGNKIEDDPARLIDTKMMKVYLVVNIDPNRPPKEFELESFVQLRNLKTE